MKTGAIVYVTGVNDQDNFDVDEGVRKKNRDILVFYF